MRRFTRVSAQSDFRAGYRNLSTTRYLALINPATISNKKSYWPILLPRYRPPKSYEWYRVSVELSHPVADPLSLLDDTSQLPRHFQSLARDLESPLDYIQSVGDRICACGIPTDAIAVQIDFYTQQLETNLSKFNATLKTTGLQNGPSWEVKNLNIHWTTTWRTASDEKTDFLRLRSGFNLPSLNFQLSQLSQNIKGDVQKPSSKVPLQLFHPTLGLHDELLDYYLQSAQNNEDSCLDLARKAFELAEENKHYSDLDMVIIGNSLSKHRDHDFMKETKPAGSILLLRREWLSMKPRSPTTESDAGKRGIFIALGSNLGDRLNQLESACGLMAKEGIKLLRTSGLYETKPMYMEDQGQFLNGVCEVETSLGPLELLRKVKEIESELGRVKTVDNGPRPVDLDILLYDSQVICLDDLIVPHPKMMEREFVLRPLCDLVPQFTLPAASSREIFKDQLERLPKTGPTLSPKTQLSPHLPSISSRSPDKTTHLMTVLNLTPDSFSDGGLHSIQNPTPLLANIKHQLSQKHPPTILDIGGQSTRPNASTVTPEEELSRLLPTIKAVRSDPSFTKLAISVDTYRASVALAAIEAGADVVNDVSAGQLDAEMLPTIARLGCTCILMHMRGDPSTMTKLTDYPNGIIEGVGSELLARVREAEAAGIRRWRIMLDPGIGFAKTQAQNLELLRRFSELRAYEGLHGLPWVVGASRKGFIGKITGVEEPSERIWGTSACVTAAVQGGADVVRVHDVKEMGEVVAMADAVWRVG